MIYLNVWLKVKDPAHVDRVRGLLTQQAQLSRQEPGCVRFEVYQSQNDPATFMLNEHWETQTAVDAHRKAHAYTTVYQPQVLPLVDRQGHPSNLVA